MAEELRVLLVDDEDVFRETLVKLLKKSNLQVAEAPTGQKGLDLLDQREFDVVVLDVKMPGLDGIETLREMKRKKPLTEVILLTGHGSVESGIDGMKLGAFDYVMKPVNMNELLNKMRQAYERKVVHEEER